MEGKVDVTSTDHLSYPGSGPGPGRVWSVCCGGRTPWQSRRAGQRSPVHSGPLGSPAGGCQPLLSGTLQEKGKTARVMKRSETSCPNSPMIGLLQMRETSTDNRKQKDERLEEKQCGWSVIKESYSIECRSKGHKWRTQRDILTGGGSTDQ